MRRFRVIPYFTQTLVGRVFGLYLCCLTIFLAAGFTLFYQLHYRQTLETAQESAQVFTELMAQTITESALIGDFDTIQRTMDKAVSGTPFDRATYIDVQGGLLHSDAAPLPHAIPPTWLRRLVEGDLSEVNHVISAGGRDYGVLRLTFDTAHLAGDLWSLLSSALQLAVLALAGGAVAVLLALRTWLGRMDQAIQVSRSAAPEQSPALRQLLDGMPLEIRPMVLALHQTAASLRTELAARERAVTSLRQTLSGLVTTANPASEPDDGPEEMARLSDSVNRLVAERELAYEALQLALDDAREANRAKSAFLANVSHEVRTPINGILGMTDLALETALDEEQREFLTIARASANALMGVVNDLLDFSKIEAGQMQVEQLAFDPRQIAEEACCIVKPQANGKGLAMEWRATASVPSALLGDPTRLRQVLLNLLSNGVKFTSQGSVNLHLDRGTGAGGGATLEVSVEDTGIGIPSHLQGRIFEAFVQADVSVTRRHGGSGLGLSICRRLVELMGGSMGVDSTPGRGSTFLVSLPLVEPDLAAVEA